MVLTMPYTLLKDLHILISQWSFEADNILSPCSRREASSGGGCSLSHGGERVGVEPAAWVQSLPLPLTGCITMSSILPSLPVSDNCGYDQG